MRNQRLVSQPVAPPSAVWGWVRRGRGMLAAAVAVLAAAMPADAHADIVVKLATLAPKGSAWHEILRDLGERWREASGGRVTLRVYPGGVHGNEGDMVRKMAIGQLHAAALTNIGLQNLAPEPRGLSIPLFFRDAAQAACVFDRVRPRLEELVSSRGYVVLSWSRIGTVQLFCDRPCPTPSHASGARVFAQGSDSDALEAWRSAGFTPVVLSVTDLPAAVRAGMVNCVPSLPAFVLATRLFETVDHVLDLEWAHMYAATVMRKDTWEELPNDVRPRLMELARDAGHMADAAVRKINTDALDAMRRRGLKVVRGNSEAWRVAVAAGYASIRGGSVPAEFFDELAGVRETCSFEAVRSPR